MRATIAVDRFKLRYRSDKKPRPLYMMLSNFSGVQIERGLQMKTFNTLQMNLMSSMKVFRYIRQTIRDVQQNKFDKR